MLEALRRQKDQTAVRGSKVVTKSGRGRRKESSGQKQPGGVEVGRANSIIPQFRNSAKSDANGC